MISNCTCKMVDAQTISFSKRNDEILVYFSDIDNNATNEISRIKKFINLPFQLFRFQGLKYDIVSIANMWLNALFLLHKMKTFNISSKWFCYSGW